MKSWYTSAAPSRHAAVQIRDVQPIERIHRLTTAALKPYPLSSISLQVRTKNTTAGEGNPHAMAKCLPTHKHTQMRLRQSRYVCMLCANAIAQGGGTRHTSWHRRQSQDVQYRCRRIPCNHLWRPVYNPNGAEWEMEASQRPRLAPTARIRNGRCR